MACMAGCLSQHTLTFISQVMSSVIRVAAWTQHYETIQNVTPTANQDHIMLHAPAQMHWHEQMPHVHKFVFYCTVSIDTFAID